MSKSGIVWKDWNPGKVKATISARLEDNMEEACLFVEEQARKNIHSRSGQLAKAIDHKIIVSDDVVEGIVYVRHGFWRTHIARFLEFGTRKMRAHPFLRPAVFNNVRQIRRILTGK